jgi:CheY-like chemotaxis protein
MKHAGADRMLSLTKSVTAIFRNRGQDRNHVPATPRRVLVVDDNIDAADSLVVLLKSSGYTVAAAHTAEAGLALAQTFRPHLILLDLGLPAMGGYEVARRIRSSPSLNGLRMFAVTGYDEDDARRRCKEVGFEAHLVKPIDLDKLLASIACPAPVI